MTESRNDPSLRGPAVYNPRLLSKHDLVQAFVARRAVLERFVAALHREVDAQPQHHLVVGARGMGKTTLLNRLRYAIADDAILRERCLGLTFPEEQYNVGGLADFWLNCADALADQLQASGDGRLHEDIDREIASIQAGPNEDRRQRALALLCNVADRLGRRLVLLVDNVDLVLDRIPDEEQWTLREVLWSEPRIQLVGATSAPLESYYRHDRAFYDFFRVEHLQPLSVDEALTMMRDLSRVTGSEQVERLLDEDPARVKTLHLMAGGNPRTLVLLFGLLSQGVDGDVRTDVERLLDVCTPLYKHRIETLPPQAQRVLDGLAMRWFPSTATEVADAVHLDVNKVSTQLDRLAKDGTVEKVALPDTKRQGFQVAERFFNIWYLMRSSRRVRQRLGWLVEFLRLMLACDELLRRARVQLDGTENGPTPQAKIGLAYAYAIEAHTKHRALRTHEARVSYAAERVIEDPSGDPSDLRTLATMLVARGEWTEARPWARKFLSADATFLDATWPGVLRFFAESVRHGYAAQARDLVREVGASARWEPLDRALDLLARDDLPAIGRLAPEMRKAVELVLAAIAPDVDVPT